MAHITEIKIDGLLGRKNSIHLKLERDVNIFFGENGCGKTTLLKVLDAAMYQNSEAMQQLPVSRAEVHVFSISQNKTIKHTWERKQKDLLSDDFFLRQASELSIEETRYFANHMTKNEWKLSPAPKGAKNQIHRWAHTFLPTTRLYLGGASVRAASSKNQLSERQLDELFSESVNKAWLVYYSQVLNEVRRIQEQGLRTVLHNVLSSSHTSLAESKLDPADAYSRVSKFLMRHPDGDTLMLGSPSSFKSRYQKDENLRRVVDNLDNVERSIEVAMVPINRFKTTVESLFSRGKKISSSSDRLDIQLENGELLSPANLSSGEKHLIKILLAAMTSESNSVLIDEPELSMHIDWQRIFVRTVQELNPDCQLILASHSPEIMADIPDNKIFRI